MHHPTRDDLDAVSADTPVLIVHQSGHIGALNSAALEVAGIDADSENPPGGVIRRQEGSSEPNGVVEETGFFVALQALLSSLDADAGRSIFRAGTELVASYGYTTAQEGRSTPASTRVMQLEAQENGLDIDVVAYPDVLIDRDFILEAVSSEYAHRFRVGGGN
ncbi:amidohydrolase family protein [Thioalkalivibrio nitratireducens]|uniref:amidohydrolase family protein n=1 Tax=Thioalkalivibrio nitratireducens TaxID=186931 RepID=UPI00031D1E8D|nr:amidohydrolase family protein [Thioalkalivibrio nitratireducens]